MSPARLPISSCEFAFSPKSAALLKKAFSLFCSRYPLHRYKLTESRRWEHFTTKPWFDGEDTKLKKIGEIYTPWPSWHIAASTETFPSPDEDETLQAVFAALDKGIKSFNEDTEQGIRMLGNGEAQCYYSEEDGREWLKGVKFVEGTRGVDEGVMKAVVDVLKTANVIETNVQIKDGDGVVGIAR